MLLLNRTKNIRLNSTHSITKQTNKNFNQLLLIIRQISTLKTINLYKKRTAKPYCFLVIAAILASNNRLRFRKNLSEGI